MPQHIAGEALRGQRPIALHVLWLAVAVASLVPLVVVTLAAGATSELIRGASPVYLWVAMLVFQVGLGFAGWSLERPPRILLVAAPVVLLIGYWIWGWVLGAGAQPWLAASAIPVALALTAEALQFFRTRIGRA